MYIEAKPCGVGAEFSLTSQPPEADMEAVPTHNNCLVAASNEPFQDLNIHWSSTSSSVHFLLSQPYLTIQHPSQLPAM